MGERQRHSWKQWRYGHSSLAVDGLSTDNNLPNCAIMDNYYVDAPVWRVDLGKQTKVAGMVVTTWQGLGQGEAEMNHHRNVGIELVGKHGRNLKVKLEKKPASETQGCPLDSTISTRVARPCTRLWPRSSCHSSSILDDACVQRWTNRRGNDCSCSCEGLY